MKEKEKKESEKSNAPFVDVASTTAAQQHWLAPAAVYEQQWPSRPFPLPSIEACLCPGALHCTTGSGGEGGEQAVAICYVLAKRTGEEEG
ncbi:hypothetical protein TYRP_005142 [Tyrophagus putrescentiae]|nr:hypothetical protein TYRP_005142 [Tyrophagus putrescentiae]